ncbi:MAG: sel1 repeat family protein [Motiliproteus sp.]
MMRCFRLAADSGHQQALSVYGHLLCLRGDSSKSKIQGGIYLEQAAQLGDMKACYQVAKLYEEGFEGYFVINQDKALGYYQQAAELNHVLAVGRLADAYQAGELGLEIDTQLSQQWRQRLPG